MSTQTWPVFGKLHAVVLLINFRSVLVFDKLQCMYSDSEARLPLIIFSSARSGSLASTFSPLRRGKSGAGSSGPLDDPAWQRKGNYVFKARDII